MSDDAAGPAGHGPGDPNDALGSAAEEAAKLFGALGDWAKEHSGDVANNLAVGLTAGLAGLASHAQAAASDLGRDLGRDLDQHLATGAPECTYCPLCRTVHVVREAGPEVMTHMVSAAASLMQAASAVLAAAGASGQTSRRSPSVEKIDLDSEPGWSDDWPTDSGEGQETQE